MKNDFIGYIEISLEQLVEKFSKDEPIVLKPPPKPHNQDAGSLRIMNLTFYEPASPEGKVNIGP